MKKIDWYIICGLFLFLPLFLYNLEAFSLIDFDEGWYAEIARNISIYHQPSLLTFNNLPYFDHPPLGFNLMAISYSFFGVNEFAARFPSAILGFFTIIILYLLGKNLFNRIVGIGASLFLVSCVWFVFRARSGNLDTIFLFFYVLTFYCAVKIKTNSNWIFALTLSFSAVMLAKSIIGVTILLPVVAYLFIEKVKLPFKKITLAVILFFITFLPWYLENYFVYGSAFLTRNFSIAVRSGAELFHSSALQYLHFGIGKWYYPAFISFFGSLIFIRKDKKLFPLILLIGFLLFGFLSNSKTEIWHLIPLYPFLALLTSYFVFRINKHLPLLFLAVVIFQIYQFRNQINLFDQHTSGLAHTAAAAKNYPDKLYLDASDFMPSVSFYSQKRVYFMRLQVPPQNTLNGLIEFGPKPFLLLTEQWRLDIDKIPVNKYEILDSYGGYVLVHI